MSEHIRLPANTSKTLPNRGGLIAQIEMEITTAGLVKFRTGSMFNACRAAGAHATLGRRVRDEGEKG
jgi:hypothetical protein